MRQPFLISFIVVKALLSKNSYFLNKSLIKAVFFPLCGIVIFIIKL